MLSPMSSWNQSDLASIAFVFVACAKMTDGDLSEVEIVRIVERIAGWMPGASTAELHAVLARAVELFKAAPDDQARHQLVSASTNALHERMVPEDRERLVTELIALVQVDGRVDDSEANFVFAIAEILGVDVRAYPSR